MAASRTIGDLLAHVVVSRCTRLPVGHFYAIIGATNIKKNAMTTAQQTTMAITACANE